MIHCLFYSIYTQIITCIITTLYQNQKDINQLLLVINYYYMTSIFTLLIICTALSLTLSQGHLKPKQHLNKNENKTIIVEDNHFISNTSKQDTFTIQNSQPNKPLVTTISPKKKTDIYKNPVTIILKSGTEQVTCLFKSYEDLCVLEKVPTTPSYLTVKCRDLPCDVYFTTSQSPLLQTLSQQQLDELYKFDQNVKHNVMMFSCNDPDIENYESMLRVYTNQPYTRTYTNNVIYYLFDNVGKGYMLIESDDKARRCTTMSVSKTPSSLQNGLLIRDFITKQGSSFEIAAPKDSDLRIDMSYHELDRDKVVKSSLSLQLFGIEGSNKKFIHKFTIQNLEGRSNLIADVVFPKNIFSSYSRLSLKIYSNETLLLVTIVPVYAKSHEIDMQQTSFFTLKQGQTLSYKISPQPSNDNTKVQIELINDNNNAQVSTQTCSIRQGCNFTVSAKGTVNQAGLRVKPMGTKTQGSISYITINSTYTGKIREGQIIYFMHTVANKTDLQIMVSSPNTLIYAADKSCPKPSETCNNYSGNSKEQIQIQQEMVGVIYIAVEGLDNSRFTLRVIQNSQYFIELKDGEPFSYTLKQQNQIGFIFKIKDYSSDVKFNLVAPLNSMNMYVNNDAEEISVDNANLKSYSGDVTFKKSELKSNDFTILLSKIHNQTNKQKVHFTLIASTHNTILPLEPSIAHYEQLHFHQPVKFILEYNRKTTTLLNIYVSDVSSDTELPIVLKVANDLKEFANTEQIPVDKMRQTIDLEEYGSDLCKTTLDYCELYLQIVNNGEITLDTTLTLLTRDAIVELKDGIWQSFPIKQMTSSFHFYFMPKHQNNSINVMYKSTFKHLQLIYKLWTISKDKLLNMEDWPFPSSDLNSTKKQAYNQMQSISISSDNLKKCWPNCVVLFSFVNQVQKNDSASQIAQRLSEFDHFSILASNDIISLIEREKIEIILHKNEQKQLIIDLKHILDKEHLTFFSYTIIGSVKILGDLSSNKNLRRPSLNDFDYTFGQLETQVNIGKIKDKLNALNIQNDEELYMRIVVFPETESKITFQYSTKENKIKQLHYQSFETIKIAANEEKTLQLIPTFDYKLKIIRIKGFPFISVKECPNKDLNDCMQEMVQSNFRQMTSKTQEHQGKMDTSKLVVVKIQAKEEVEIDIYAQTPYGQIQLKEGEIVTDFSLANETMRYSITGLRLSETVLTVNVLQGNPTVKVFDYDGLNITRTKKVNGLIHIPLPPKAANTFNLANNLAHGFGLNSIFSSIHVTIIDQTMNTFYTIQYTSGDRGLVLQDGLLSTVVVEANHNMTFYYHSNVLQQQPIVVISADTPQELKVLEIKISYTNDESEGEEMKVQTPEFKPKTPRPTILFRLPKDYRDYEVFLINTSPKINASVSVVVNQDQILMLPYNVEYPVILKQGQSQNLMTQVNNEGYLVLTIKKCDAGVPTIAYSFDRDSFASKDYTFQSQIKEEMRAQYFIKGVSGTLYINVESNVPSSFSLMLNYYSQKSSIPKDTSRPGNHGMLEYELINSIQAEISFHPIQCDNKTCPKISYSYMASTSLQSVYSQSLCPSYFFTYSQSNKPLESKPIKVPQKSKEVKFPYKLIDQISYVTVKATSESGKEYIYKPVQIVTIWGHIARNKHYHLFFLFLIGGLVLCCVLVGVRRFTKPGYRPLNEIQ